jgi:hypothetical protein
MKKEDRIFCICFLMIALSFWIDLAWAWFTHQGKDSFYVGAAVIAAGMWFFIDSILFVIGISYAVRGLWKKRVSIQEVGLRWLILFIAPVPSFYLSNKVAFALFPPLWR